MMRGTVAIGLLALVACTPTVNALTFPVSSVPNWGAMTMPEQWERTYEEIPEEEYVPVPLYDMRDLTTPWKDIVKDRNSAESIRLLTAKLFYSTRYCAKKHLDAAENSDPKREHCAIDLKLPEGTPVVALANGIAEIREDAIYGKHVMLEFQNRGKTYVARYAHLATAIGGDPIGSGSTIRMFVASGFVIGTVGSTGKSTLPHLHLDIADAKGRPVNPMSFFPNLLP